jgi:hypothetical protein
MACSPHPQPAGRRLRELGGSFFRVAFLRAPANFAEAGGPVFVGPSAAWMPPPSLHGWIHGVSREDRAIGFPTEVSALEKNRLLPQPDGTRLQANEDSAWIAA